MTRLYFAKRFLTGTLRGLAVPSWRDFPDPEDAWHWATKVGKGRDILTGTRWTVEEPVFQKIARD